METFDARSQSAMHFRHSRIFEHRCSSAIVVNRLTYAARERIKLNGRKSRSITRRWKLHPLFFHGWISRYFHFQRFAPGTCHDAQRSRNFRMYNHGERAVLGSSASPPNFFDYTRSCFCFLSVRRARFFPHPLYLAYVHVSMITCTESMRFKKKCSHPFRNLQAYTFGPSR